MHRKEARAILKAITNWLKKQSAINNILVTFYKNQPVWSKPRFEELVEAGYITNVYVYRCVNVISQACAGIPWVLYNQRGELKEIERSPLLNLISRPNPYQGQAKFIENMVSYLLLSGNSYIERVGPNTGPPRELYTLRPDKMYVVGGDRLNPVSGYEYRDYGKTHKFDFKHILHLKTFSPLDYWYGLSPVRVADRSVVANNAAKAWNVSLLQNSARPSGALVTEHLSDREQNRLKRQIDEKYEGAWNAGRPLLLSGGLDWKQMSLNPADMDWLAGQKLTAKEIAITFGVPPELIGDAESKTYANYKEGRSAFYMETILPLMDFLRDEWNNWLTPLFGQNLYLDYDKDQIEAIQEDRQIVWNQAITALEAGIITTDEAREMIGYGEFPSRSPVDNEEPANIEGELEEKAKTNPEREAYWKKYDAMRTIWESALIKLIQKQFKKEAEEVARAVREAPTLDSIVGRAAGKISVEEWTKLYNEMYEDTMNAFGNFTENELKSRKNSLETKQIENEELWVNQALAYIQNTVSDRVAEILNTTSDRIQEVVLEGLRQGMSKEEIAEEIEELYADMEEERAPTIARTESLTGSQAGSYFAVMALGILTGITLKKNWLTMQDRKVRPSHARVNGERKGVNEPYSNGLMFPGDPEGSPEEVINCRCVEWYD